MPKTNMVYWKAKIEHNKARDKYVNRVLRSKGWRVLRFWEHQVEKNLDFVTDRICMEMNKAVTPRVKNSRKQYKSFHSKN
jgi:G:T-mismatch repair DNA endonuclease (very short patch repair protein)